MYRFLIVVEKADGNYSAYSPDLPGCVATGRTREQVTRNMHEAIEMHVRGLLEDKLPVPKSHSFAEYVAVPSGVQQGPEVAQLPSTIHNAVESGLRDAWKHDHDDEQRALLKLKDALLSHEESVLRESEPELEKRPVSETSTGIKLFRTLSQAIAFIAECIERDSPSELMAQMAQVGGPKSGYAGAFVEWVFPKLRTCHEEMDLRSRYKDWRFLSNEARFTLGGHMKELGCLHIDFVHTALGWRLDDIWECRQG